MQGGLIKGIQEILWSSRSGNTSWSWSELEWKAVSNQGSYSAFVSFFLFVDQQLANTFCKGPANQYFKLCGFIQSLLQLLNSEVLVWKSHRQCPQNFIYKERQRQIWSVIVNLLVSAVCICRLIQIWIFHHGALQMLLSVPKSTSSSEFLDS